MGAKIVKLINEDSSLEDGSDFDRVRDLEEGEESSSWDSSSSSKLALDADGLYKHLSTRDL